MTRTAAQRTGDAAEALVERHLTRRGWRILARRLRVGRSELDLVALDPGPPPRLVAVEVRWRSARDWGLPEETWRGSKRRSVRAGLARLLAAGALPDGRPLPRAVPAIDLVAVEPGPVGGGPPRLRHHRDVG
ncbi:MAG: hypothetical protein RL338_932 [Chloroflexota bacterium]